MELWTLIVEVYCMIILIKKSMLGCNDLIVEITEGNVYDEEKNAHWAIFEWIFLLL